MDFEFFELLIKIWEGTTTLEQLKSLDEKLEVTLEVTSEKEPESSTEEKTIFVQGPIFRATQVAILADRLDLPLPIVTQYLNHYIANLSLENLDIPTLLVLLNTFRSVEEVPLFFQLYHSLANKLLSIYVKGMEDSKDCAFLLQGLISTLDTPLPEVCTQIGPILSSDTLTIDQAIQGLVGLEKLAVRSNKIEERTLTYLKDFHDSLQAGDENADESAQAEKALKIITKLLESVSNNVYPKIYQRFLFLLLVIYINRDSLPRPEWITTVSELVQKPQFQEIPPELLYHPFIEGLIHELLPRLSGLKHFTFVKEDMLAQLLTVLPKKLETLELGAHIFEEEALEHLNSTTTLKKLRLQTNNNFNGTTLTYFVNNVELEILDLTHNNLTDNDLRALESFKKLTGLCLAKNVISQNPFTHACLNYIAQCKDLRLLDLSGSTFGVHLIELIELKELRVFVLNALANQQQILDLYVLSKFAELQELGCRNNCHALNPTLVEQIVQHAPSLKVLDLGHDTTPCLVVDEDLTRLNQLAKLEDLNLDRSRITHEGLNHLVGLPIQHLSLNFCEGINDQVFEVLSLFPKLKTLNLVHTAVTSEALAAWAANHPDIKILTAENAAEINLIRKQDRGAYIWPNELPEYAAWTAMERGIP